VNPQTRKRAGFTLIEVMAVVALIGVVFFVALHFYADLARATTRASDHTRGIRRASAILDRVARDIEGAFLLVKPPELDPFAFPWIFLGQVRLGGDSSEQLKFITRNHDPTRTSGAETNLATVAYFTESAPDDSISLYRWSWPRLPERLDKSFPTSDDDGAFLLAEGLQSFGFSFVGEDQEVLREWDSSTLLESSSLPLAVEIQLSLRPDGEEDEQEPAVYRRRVLIPVRPLDLAALADPNSSLFAGNQDEDSEQGDGNDGEGEGSGPGSERDGKGGELTNAVCIPESVPASAGMCAQMLVGLAKSAPDMAFTPEDYQSLPPDCQAIVDPKCRGN
jgi:prepilin-type N-terminal cleavage/methylation domain-containing protein